CAIKVESRREAVAGSTPSRSAASRTRMPAGAFRCSISSRSRARPTERISVRSPAARPMAPLLSRERRLDSARRRVRKLRNHMLAEKADRVQHAPLLDDAAIHDEDHVFDAELVLEELDLLGHRVGRADDV